MKSANFCVGVTIAAAAATPMLFVASRGEYSLVADYEETHTNLVRVPFFTPLA